MDTDRENRSIRSKPRTNATLSTKTSHGLTRDGTRGSAVRGRLLTALAMDSKAYYLLLLFFLHPLFSLSFLFSSFFNILYFCVERVFRSASLPHYNTALLPKRP